MRTISFVAALLTCLALMPHGELPAELLATEVTDALSTDESIAQGAIARLHNRGRKAFYDLLALRDHLATSAAGGIEIDRLDAVIDQVGGARYSTVSRLYWHTNLPRARAEARTTGRPILSLRMMGMLTDEFSCANSRFFRTALYANKQISEYLRDKYVLHWKSVRPVPRVTVDYGDGRKLERTLTGNSIHYVMTSDGEVIDGLPGLYGPAPFLAWLKEMHSLGTAVNEMEGDGAQVSDFLKRWHRQKLAEVTQRWQADLRKIAADEPAEDAVPPPADQAERDGKVDPAPAAHRAAAFTVNKNRIEGRLIGNVTFAPVSVEATNLETWEKIAALHAGKVKLDDASVRLIRSENPTAAESSWLAFLKRSVEDPVARMVAEFESSMALDTVRNEYELHRKLHQWFAEGTAAADAEELNEQVYAELFLTPSSDPWIGLVPKDVYTGLTNAGVVWRERLP